MKKIFASVLVGVVFSSLVGCKTDVNSLLGKDGGGLHQTPGRYCDGRDYLQESGRSLGNRGCGRPDKNLVQTVYSGTSDELQIRIKKMSDGKFPIVDLSYQPLGNNILQGISFTCTPEQDTGDAAFGIQTLSCKPDTDRRMSRIEMASSDQRLRLNYIRFSTDCGAHVSYYKEGPSQQVYCGISAENEMGVELGQFIAPDYYIEAEF